eukprot:g15883.t1
MAVTTLALAGPNARNPGDWPCQFCKKVQFGRDLTCKDCGARRPVACTYGTPLPAAEENPLQSPTGRRQDGFNRFRENLLNFSRFAGQPGDWTCPKCKTTCFARNPVCGRCNCPKPETVEEYNLLAQAAVGLLPGHRGSARGYVPPTVELKADSSSPWARQWTAGPVNGMFIGETNLPGWLTGAAATDRNDKDSSESESAKAKKRKLEAQGKAEIAKKKAEEEEEKRRQMRERRKDRVIRVD